MSAPTDLRERRCAPYALGDDELVCVVRYLSEHVRALTDGDFVFTGVMAEAAHHAALVVRDRYEAILAPYRAELDLRRRTGQLSDSAIAAIDERARIVLGVRA
jgi:hypothetical protein